MLVVTLNSEFMCVKRLHNII